MSDNGDEDDRPPPRLMGPRFWIALAFGLFCVIAGFVLATLGPRYL
jgi:hypothetical protein